MIDPWRSKIGAYALWSSCATRFGSTMDGSEASDVAAPEGSTERIWLILRNQLTPSGIFELHGADLGFREVL